MLLKWGVCACGQRGQMKDTTWRMRKMDDRRAITKNKREKGRSGIQMQRWMIKTSTWDRWLTGGETDWRERRERRQCPNLLSFSDKRRVGTKAWPSAVWSADKALQLWNGEGPLWSQISPQQYLTQHKRAAGPSCFMSGLATKLPDKHWKHQTTMLFLIGLVSITTLRLISWPLRSSVWECKLSEMYIVGVTNVIICMWFLNRIIKNVFPLNPLFPRCAHLSL